jgi:hypothetical protein
VFGQHILHAFTPETERSCHYFYGVARNWRVHDPDLTNQLLSSTGAVFLQDKEGLEAIERIAVSHCGNLREISVRSDQPGLQMRRLVRRASRRSDRNRGGCHDSDHGGAGFLFLASRHKDRELPFGPCLGLGVRGVSRDGALPPLGPFVAGDQADPEFKRLRAVLDQDLVRMGMRL